MMTAVEASAVLARKAGALIRSSLAERFPANRSDWRGPERRREVRYATCDPAEVQLLDLAGLQIPGIVRDLSKNGLCVEIALPVTPGARLKIRLRSHAIFGEVRYCRRTADAYQVGVAIQDVYFAPTIASRIGMEPEVSGQENRELARFILDDHLCSPFNGFAESKRRLPFASKVAAQ